MLLLWIVIAAVVLFVVNVVVGCLLFTVVVFVNCSCLLLLLLFFVAHWPVSIRIDKLMFLSVAQDYMIVTVVRISFRYCVTAGGCVRIAQPALLVDHGNRETPNCLSMVGK